MKTTQTYYHPRRQGEDILTYTKRTKANTSYLQELKEGGFEIDVGNYYYPKYAPKVTHWVTVALSKNNLNDYIEDASQEVWTKVLTYFSTYNLTKPFEGWLNKVTQHVIADFINKINEQQVMEQSFSNLEGMFEEFIDETKVSPEEALYRRGELIELMKSISPQEEKVLMLLLDKAPYDEIVQTLDLTYNQVRWTAEKIREKILQYSKI